MTAVLLIWWLDKVANWVMDFTFIWMTSILYLSFCNGADVNAWHFVEFRKYYLSGIHMKLIFFVLIWYWKWWWSCSRFRFGPTSQSSVCYLVCQSLCVDPSVMWLAWIFIYHNKSTSWNGNMSNYCRFQVHFNSVLCKLYKQVHLS